MGIYVRLYSWSVRLFLASCPGYRTLGRVPRSPHSSFLYLICFTSSWNTPVHPNLCCSIVLCILRQSGPRSSEFLKDLFSALGAGWLLWKVVTAPLDDQHPMFVVNVSAAWRKEYSLLHGLCLQDSPTFVKWFHKPILGQGNEKIFANDFYSEKK